MSLYAGVDAGSRSIKIVLWDAEADCVVARAIADQGVQQNELARDLFARLLEENALAPGDVARTVATGYGRNRIDFARTTVTEITCQAQGVAHLRPDSHTVIDVGGQDSKLIRLDGAGRVRDFAMNDRCAAGTGRFLEVVAQRLGVGIDDLGEFASRSEKPASISSVCVVFAESEIVGLLASGTSSCDIVAGVQDSIARRVAGMAGRNVAEPVVFTGGVALVPGMKDALERALGRPVEVSPDPQFTGALGAALVAGQRTE
ncbi:2-hydroxyglutaryl-CoA dehydratase [Candidatus Sumerlaeota bacterium]|nr:2-hydroxyglutaryl-CoA dehydratase [Candidatus Sumerlaeota bacterium]